MAKLRPMGYDSENQANLFAILERAKARRIKARDRHDRMHELIQQRIMAAHAAATKAGTPLTPAALEQIRSETMRSTLADPSILDDVQPERDVDEQAKIDAANADLKALVEQWF